MTAADFISTLPAERQELMAALHNAITANDHTVEPVVEEMMGKTMILYKENSVMKYGLASVKKHMSLHCLPLYCSAVLHSKYTELFPRAKLQKGCINFTDAQEVPVNIVTALITDSAGINIAEMLSNLKKSKKQ